MATLLSNKEMCTFSRIRAH